MFSGTIATLGVCVTATCGAVTQGCQGILAIFSRWF